MSLVATRKPLLGNVIKLEYAREHGFCRELVEVFVSADTELSVGSVLGMNSTTKQYAPRDPAASDGTEVAAAIVVENKSVPASTATGVAAIVRGPAIAANGGLVFDVTHTETEIEEAIAEIETLGVVVREQV